MKLLKILKNISNEFYFYRFGVAQSSAEARNVAEGLKTNNLVLKAQVLAGGRGKGAFKNGFKGGVRLTFSPQEAEQIASKMINQTLVTKQTGEAGRLCSKVMVAERKFPRREFYFAIMMERAFNVSFFISDKFYEYFVSSSTSVSILGTRFDCLISRWC